MQVLQLAVCQAEPINNQIIREQQRPRHCAVIIYRATMANLLCVMIRKPRGHTSSSLRMLHAIAVG